MGVGLPLQGDSIADATGRFAKGDFCRFASGEFAGPTA